jgi:hypothetical protein
LFRDDDRKENTLGLDLTVFLKERLVLGNDLRICLTKRWRRLARSSPNIVSND